GKGEEQDVRDAGRYRCDVVEPGEPALTCPIGTERAATLPIPLFAWTVMTTLLFRVCADRRTSCRILDRPCVALDASAHASGPARAHGRWVRNTGIGTRFPTPSATLRGLLGRPPRQAARSNGNSRHHRCLHRPGRRARGVVDGAESSGSLSSPAVRRSSACR